MKTKIYKHKYKKGDTGHLDSIYMLMGVLPEEAWDYVDDDPTSEAYIFKKNVSLEIKITM